MFTKLPELTERREREQLVVSKTTQHAAPVTRLDSRSLK